MDELCADFPWLTAGATPLERLSPTRTRWWTFAGLKANATLADHLSAAGSLVASRDNLSLTFETASGVLSLQEHLPTPAVPKPCVPPAWRRTPWSP